MTTTSTGLPIPMVDVSAARSAALRIRRARTAADACLHELANASPPDWSGMSSQLYLEGRAVVSRSATDLGEACSLLDRAVVDFGDEAASVLPRWRSAAERLERAEAAVADPASAGSADATVVGLEALLRERDDLHLEVVAWERRFGEAEMALSAACSQVLAIVDDGRVSTGDQLWAIPATVVQQMVVEPVELAAMLVDDPGQVDDVAKAAWLGFVDQVTHPRRTAEDMAGVPAFADGRWGEGVGTGVTTVAGFIGARRPSGDLPDPHTPKPAGGGPRRNTTPLTPAELVKFARNIQRHDAPVPTTQTLDEMVAGVDLERSEHATLGHTLSRHVDVDDDYLLFRLEHGTPMPDGTHNRKESTASAWVDRATAEATITTAVKDHRLQIERWMSEGGDDYKMDVRGDDLGLVMRVVEGTPVIDVAQSVTIHLARDDHGGVYVRTTLLRR